MGVKETPITADADEENGEGEEENGSGEEAPPEEQESKQEETPPEEAKPKRAKAKPKPAAKKKVEEKPKKKPEEKPEERPKPPKSKAKKETVDQKTSCSICKSEPISTDALLYTHSCKKEALAKRKTAPLYDEVAAQPPQGTAMKIPWQSGEAVPRQPSLGYEASEPPQPSYREILAREQQEMRRQKAARIVNPIRAHFFGYA